MTFQLPEKKTVPEHQADTVLTQANPVSGTKYTVLDTTKNVRIIAMMIKITWATTQPTILRIYVTIDGCTEIFGIANPVSGTNYQAVFSNWYLIAGDQTLQTADIVDRSFLFEGRSVKIEAYVEWATTQPTPLECRVKYAKW